MYSELLLSVNFWLLLGIVLVILDLVFGLQFFVLSFGVGAVVTGIILAEPILLRSLIAINSTSGALLCFAVCSLVLIIPIRKIIYTRYNKGKDINDY